MAPSIKIENVDLEIKEFNLPIDMDLVNNFIKKNDKEILDLKYTDINKLNKYYIKKIHFLIEEGFANNLDEALEKCKNIYIYENQTMEQIAYNHIQECYGNVIDNLYHLVANNIDYSGIARDLEEYGNFYKVGSDIFEYHFEV